MKQFIQNILIVLIFVSCVSKSNHLEIEKFVWIRHNLNFASTPNDLIAKEYLEYNASLQRFNYAKRFFNPVEHFFIKPNEFYYTKAPNDFDSLIISYLSNKKFKSYYVFNDSNPPIYDGDYYCFIYKFKNQKSIIINYIPCQLPDSLKGLHLLLENIAKKEWLNKADSFDVITEINKNKQEILKSGPLGPVPLEIRKK